MLLVAMPERNGVSAGLLHEADRLTNLMDGVASSNSLVDVQSLRKDGSR
jgi:hypothetical protein